MFEDWTRSDICLKYCHWENCVDVSELIWRWIRMLSWLPFMSQTTCSYTGQTGWRLFEAVAMVYTARLCFQTSQIYGESGCVDGAKPAAWRDTRQKLPAPVPGIPNIPGGFAIPQVGLDGPRGPADLRQLYPSDFVSWWLRQQESRFAYDNISRLRRALCEGIRIIINASCIHCYISIEKYSNLYMWFCILSLGPPQTNDFGHMQDNLSYAAG
jgi:hypothetical protein